MDHAASSRGAAYVASVLQPESMSPLMMAALSGSTGCILLLLQRGAVVDHENDIRSTALHYAAWRGHYAAVKVLLEHGACVDVADNNGAAVDDVVCALLTHVRARCARQHAHARSVWHRLQGAHVGAAEAFAATWLARIAYL